MKTLKLVFAFFPIFLSNLSNATIYDSGWVENPWIIEIQNEEVDSINDFCTINYVIRFKDTVVWQHKLVLSKTIYAYDSGLANDWWIGGDSNNRVYIPKSEVPITDINNCKLLLY